MSTPHPRASTESRVSTVSGYSSTNDSRAGKNSLSDDGLGSDQTVGWGQQSQWPNDPRAGKRGKPSSGSGGLGPTTRSSSLSSHQGSATLGSIASGATPYPGVLPQGQGSKSNWNTAHSSGATPPWSPTSSQGHGRVPTGPNGLPFNHGPTELPPRPYGAGESFNPSKPRGKIPGSAMEFVSLAPLF